MADSSFDTSGSQRKKSDPQKSTHFLEVKGVACGIWYLGSVQVLYKQVFPNSGPPPPEMLILHTEYKHFWSYP